MREFKARREAANKCMALHDQWLGESQSTTDPSSAVALLAKAQAARECAAAVARCTLASPLVSLDKAVRVKAWNEPIIV
jgi:hypothetical protein